MSSAEYTNQSERVKKKFQVMNSAFRSDLNHHYSTVSGPTAPRLKDSLNKDLYPLNPVPEDHYPLSLPSTSPTSSTPPRTTPPQTPPQPPSSSSKNVFRKPNFFTKRDPLSSSPANQSTKAYKTPGKVKNFISSIRQRSKSTSVENAPVVTVNQELYGDDSVFTNITNFDDDTLADSSLTFQLNNNKNNYNNNNNNKNNKDDNNNSNNDEGEDMIDGLNIGPDQYIAYHRDRTQFLVARKQARDKLKNLKTPLSNSLFASRHHSACLDEDEHCLDTRLLIWKDPRQGTRVYRMPSNSQKFSDSDELTSPELVYNKMLNEHTCYDLVPNSSKIVVFDSRLSIKKAFLALAKDGVKAAILWDNHSQCFSGMLTITDFVQILHKYYTSSASPSAVEDLENDSIIKWKDVFETKSLILCSPEDTVLKALKLLCLHRVHRLLIMDKKLGNAINVLTHKRILAFIHYNMSSIDPPPFLHNPLSSFPIITLGKVTTITYDMKLIQVLKLFIEHRISAVPVVDDDGCLVNIFAKFDFSMLAYDKLYSNLDRPVRDVMSAKSTNHVDMHTVQPHIPLSSAIHQIVSASVHRLILVDDNRKVIGMATLSDLLRCLVVQEEEEEEEEEKEEAKE